MTNVLIHRANGHLDILPFRSFELARYFVKNNVSYSGPHIRRVEIVSDGSTFAVWDTTWDDVSKMKGRANI